jgi:hypothetical protein
LAQSGADDARKTFSRTGVVRARSGVTLHSTRRQAKLTRRALFDLKAIGAAAVEATLQLLLIGEQLHRPDGEPDEADEEHARDDVHAAALTVLGVRFVIILHFHRARPEPRLPGAAQGFIAESTALSLRLIKQADNKNREET